MTRFDPANWSDDDFEVIPESAVEGGKRGRKPNAAALALADRLANAVKGDTIRVTALTVDPSDDKEKAAVANIIRSAGNILGRKVGIRWSPNGVPQITMK
jgi:hypothetical protein